MSRENLSAFALRLRMLRKKAKMTQAAVAEVLNLDRTAYTKYETDVARPDQASLLLLADLFHVTSDFLLGKCGQDISETELQNAATVVALSPEEEELINIFRLLTDSQRALLLETERELTGKKQEQKP